MARIIKKYPNRRLYDTETSAYITLTEVKQFVLEHQQFEVHDARTGEDLTRSILLQIILEAEGGGVPMFSSDMLANIIRYYGHAMQGMMGSYLERSMSAFNEAQRKYQEQSKSLYGNVPAFGADAWAKMMQGSTNAMPSMMSDYLEKSASNVVGMQEELSKQAMQMFSAFPFAASKPASAASPVREGQARPASKSKKTSRRG